MAQAEAQGYSLVSEDADGTLHFAAYSYDGKFNDLLKTNNGSFLSGNISAVKFLTSCSGLSGMYKWGEAVKAPVVLKVDSAYISDVNMVTDKSKPNYIEVGKLTI